MKNTGNVAVIVCEVGLNINPWKQFRLYFVYVDLFVVFSRRVWCAMMGKNKEKLKGNIDGMLIYRYKIGICRFELLDQLNNPPENLNFNLNPNPKP